MRQSRAPFSDLNSRDAQAAGKKKNKKKILFASRQSVLTGYNNIALVPKTREAATEEVHLYSRVPRDERGYHARVSALMESNEDEDASTSSMSQNSPAGGDRYSILGMVPKMDTIFVVGQENAMARERRQAVEHDLHVLEKDLHRLKRSEHKRDKRRVRRGRGKKPRKQLAHLLAQNETKQLASENPLQFQWRARSEGDARSSEEEDDEGIKPSAQTYPQPRAKRSATAKKMQLLALKEIEEDTKKSMGESILAHKEPISADNMLARKKSRPQKVKMLRAISGLSQPISSPAASRALPDSMTLHAQDLDDTLTEDDVVPHTPAYQTSWPGDTTFGTIKLDMDAIDWSMLEGGEEDDVEEEVYEVDDSSALSSSSESFDEDQESVALDQGDEEQEDAGPSVPDDNEVSASPAAHLQRLRSFSASNDMQLNYVLSDSKLRALFAEFLRRVPFDNTLHFLQAVEEMKAADEGEKRVQQAKSIYAKYLQAGGSEGTSIATDGYKKHHLHLPRVTVAVIGQMLDDCAEGMSPSVFDVVEKNVRNALAKHYIPEFTGSDLYKTLAPTRVKQRASLPTFEEEEEEQEQEQEQEQEAQEQEEQKVLKAVMKVAAAPAPATVARTQECTPQSFLAEIRSGCDTKYLMDKYFATRDVLDVSALTRSKLKREFAAGGEVDFSLAVRDVERALEAPIKKQEPAVAASAPKVALKAPVEKPKEPSVPTSWPIPTLDVLSQRPSNEHALALLRFASTIGRHASLQFLMDVAAFRALRTENARLGAARKLLEALPELQLPDYMTTGLVSRFAHIEKVCASRKDAKRALLTSDFFDSVSAELMRDQVNDTYSRYCDFVVRARPTLVAQAVNSITEEEGESDSSSFEFGTQSLARVDIESEVRRRKEEEESKLMDKADTYMLLERMRMGGTSVDLSSDEEETIVLRPAAKRVAISSFMYAPVAKEGRVSVNNEFRYVRVAEGTFFIFKKDPTKKKSKALMSVPLASLQKVDTSGNSVVLSFSSEVYILASREPKEWASAFKSWMK